MKVPDIFPPSRRHARWKSVPDADWSSWTWQLQNRIATLEDLAATAAMDPSFRINLDDVRKTQKNFNFAITPYYFSLMDLANESCPIRLQGIPSSLENVKLEHEYFDFPKEEEMMPVPGLTHRYPDRVMLYTTHHCAMYCRFCTRKRKVSNPSSALQRKQILDAIEFIKGQTSIREVILSGGDIFSFADRQLEEIVQMTRAIEHIEIIRLGTRNLVTLPLRVTPELARTLGQYQPLYIHTHFNHPNECTPEAYIACRRLRDAGCVVNNHTVMLKGINDDPNVIRELNRRLVLMGVQPYYVYHCDLTFGSSHFRTHIENDVALIRTLHGETDWTRAIDVPHYMIDTPGGGKIELV
ncbi:MAG: KamA family radical SAM protein [Bdellovibrionales bacterium]|jgi:lysine 2,3-aminomutase|nr:KamA family radical SAM protein [Bdellovibrionales bacterium]